MDKLNVELIVMWAGSYFLIGMWNRALRGLPLGGPDRYRTGYVTGNRYQDRSGAGFVTLNKHQDRYGAGFATWNKYQDRYGAGFVTWSRYQGCCRGQGRCSGRARGVAGVRDVAVAGPETLHGAQQLAKAAEARDPNIIIDIYIYIYTSELLLLSSNKCTASRVAQVISLHP